MPSAAALWLLALLVIGRLTYTTVPRRLNPSCVPAHQISGLTRATQYIAHHWRLPGDLPPASVRSCAPILLKALQARTISPNTSPWTWLIR
jgi:hypothetical protein